MSTLRLLAADADYDVRSAVAAHPGVARSVLTRLAGDSVVQVRRAVVQKAELPAVALDGLLLDDDNDVREAALTHPNLGPHSRQLADALARGMTIPPQRLRRFSKGPQLARQLVARHPYCPPDLLDELAGDASWQVREDVARHPNIGSATAARLAGDSDRDVRRAIAVNRATPGTSLAELVNDGDEMVRRHALRNPALPRDVRERGARAVHNRAARSGALLSRVIAVSGDRLSSIEMGRRRHWQSLDWQERAALARNPSVTAGVLGRLADDADLRVRAAASGALAVRSNA